MTETEFIQYWVPARRAFVGRVGDDSMLGTEDSKKLAEKLGINYAYAGDWRMINLTPELKTMLLGIVSPHAETMLKIYEIRHGVGRSWHKEKS